MQHLIYIIFFFALGACIGSFLNVVVWRLPRFELPPEAGLLDDLIGSFKALSDPPSHCPKCGTLLKWYDNIPIFGWIKLRGKCRYCRQTISIRYPIIELVTALIFTGYYIAYYLLQVRTCCPQARVLGTDYDAFGNPHEIIHPQWVLNDSYPIFLLYLFLLSGLLAASLIDAELFIIPLSIPWLMAVVGFLVHTVADHPEIPGSLNLIGTGGFAESALAAGGMLGLIISLILWNYKIIPTSFPQGEPMLSVDELRSPDDWRPPEYTVGQIYREITKEMLFLLPPLILAGTVLAAATWWLAFHSLWQQWVMGVTWLNALLGSIFGALIGAFVVWFTRIIGTIAFRKVAMGLGDVHLMFGVGAIIGAAGATIAFFLAPVFGILIAIYRLVLRKGHEVPFGPYLALGTAAVMLFYCPIQDYLQPGFAGLWIVLGQMLHGNTP